MGFIIFGGLGLVAGLLIAAYFTNPFSRFSRIKLPFKTHIKNEIISAINQNQRLRVSQQRWWRYFAILKCGVHILATRYLFSPRARASTVDGIIADIHAHRFKPHKLLVISGDHFNSLFVRNLGVFYYPLLDSRLPTSKADWQDRQRIYLQTVAYALGVFEKYPIPTTTIVPTGAWRATCVNFYAYPSDTVYGILYALAALSGRETAAPQDYAPAKHRTQTKNAAKTLIANYQTTLQSLYAHYRAQVFDETTGLVSTHLHLSGAKDITPRSSSFYDNVVFWKTTQLAMELGIITKNSAFLKSLKQRIISSFWLEKEGYFLEDLSSESKAHKYYSSDWLIVLATGFLHPSRTNEQPFFTRSVDYIQREGIDRPFAIKYQQDTRAKRQVWIVRWAVASYGGDAIWSFWGMEYIKALLLLYKETSNKAYLRQADHHIAAYKQAMIRDQGFPEVYDDKGKLLQTLLYRSIRQTGWVVGFEQVQAMRRAITK